MKKIIPVFTITPFLIGSAWANINGGFVGPQTDNLKITNVSEISKLYDDTNVIIQGKIVNSLGDEKYTFIDETGEIVVEIDDDDWNGITITPETTIQIYGEVDKGIFKKQKLMLIRYI